MSPPSDHTGRPARARIGRARVLRTVSLGFVLLVCSRSGGATAHVAPATSLQAQPEAPARRRILIIYDEDRYEYPGLGQMDLSLRESFRSGLGSSVEIHSESMDLSQFERPGYDLLLADLFRRKYADKRPDLIVAILEPPLDFLLRHRTLFQGIPIVFGGVDASAIADKKLPSDMTGVLVERTFAPTVDVALRLQPATRNVFVVGGASTFDRYLQTLVLRDVKPYEGRVAVTYLFGLPMEQLLRRLSNLPPASVILYVTVLTDGAGNRFIPHEVVSSIVASANAPVYVFLDQFVGSGAVGGNVYSNDAQGAHVAALGLQVLRGASAATLPVRHVGAQVNLFDARQLKRWHLDEARLPPGSEVQFREKPTWKLYQWYFIAGLAALIIEGALIGGLLFARARQQRAEDDLRTAAEEMRQLYVRLTNVEDDERRALHLELHDQIGANLAALRLQLDVAASLVAREDGASVERHLTAARDVVRETIAMARGLMAELRPPALDDYGLVAALRTFAESQSSRIELPIHVTGVDMSQRPSHLVEGALFRIAYEAVMNSARHASASRVTIDMGERDGRVIMTVVDDGAGFDLNAPTAGPDHWGMKNMRERARAIGATIHVETAPGAGTRVMVDAPREAV